MPTPDKPDTPSRPPSAPSPPVPELLVPPPPVPGPPPPAAAEVFGPMLGLAERYAGMLAGPGVERGLLGPAEAARLWDRHLLNCAVVAEFVPSGSSIVDLGSGAGLPGIVLAMLVPDVTVTLLEPMARRAEFLAECVRALGLGHVEVRRGRAEELAGQLAADVVIARAVAPMYKLAGLAAGLVKPGGVVLAIKGAGAEAELSRAMPELRRLGARDVQVLHAGVGKVDPAATVVRFTAGQPRSRARRPGGPGADDLRSGGQGVAGRRSGQSRGAPRIRGRGRRGRG